MANLHHTTSNITDLVVIRTDWGTIVRININTKEKLKVKFNVRVYKTNKSIYKAFGSLLKKKEFSKITVNNICKNALISKSTFYAHFTDKYDLLSQYTDQIVSIFKASISHRFEDMGHQNPFLTIDKIAKEVINQRVEMQQLISLHCFGLQFEKSIKKVLYDVCVEWLTSSNKKTKFSIDFTASLYSQIAFSSIKFSLENAEKNGEYLDNQIAFISSIQKSMLNTIFVQE